MEVTSKIVENTVLRGAFEEWHKLEALNCPQVQWNDKIRSDMFN